MTTHSNILAREIPWREEPGKLQWCRKRVSTTDQLNNNNKDAILYCFIKQSRGREWGCWVDCGEVKEATWVRIWGKLLGSLKNYGSLCWATYSSILAWRSPVDRGVWWAAVHGVAKSRKQLRLTKYSTNEEMLLVNKGFPGSSAGKESACNAGDLGSIPGLEDLLEKGTATHSSILAWRIPRTEEPGRLQSMGLQRVRHDWATFTWRWWRGRGGGGHCFQHTWDLM